MKTASINTLGITHLFPPDSLFIDADRDGYPDSLALEIHVSPSLTDPHVWAGLLNLVGRLVFGITAIDLPLVKRGFPPTRSGPCLIVLQPGQERSSGTGPVAPGQIRRDADQTIFIEGSSGVAMASLLNQLAAGSDRGTSPLPRGWRALKLHDRPFPRLDIIGRRENLLGSRPWHERPILKKRFRPRISQAPSVELINLCSSSRLYQPPSDEPRARALRAFIEIQQGKVHADLGIALAEMVTRLVLEATEIALPLVYIGKGPEAPVMFQVREDLTPGSEIRLLNKDEKHQVILAQGEPRSLAKALKNWSVWALTEGGPGAEPVDAFRNRVEAFQDLLAGRGCRRWPRHGLPLSPPSSLSPRAVLRRDASWEDEVKEILKLAGRVSPGRGPLFGEIFVSKPEATRKTLKGHLETLLMKRGYEPEVAVFNAYKPGFSWLMEHVLPSLKTLKPIATVEIAYQPFHPPEHSLELPSRWLEELFPGPEIVAQKLRLESGNIRIRRNSRLKSVYRVRAWNRRGRLIFESRFTPRWRKLRYAKGRPRAGFTHPTTGGIRLWQSGRVLLDRGVPTDREKFWDILQIQWLPLLEKQMEARLGAENPEKAFWKEILIDVCLDETDSRLGFGEERICPMEALHEDIYFHLLDAYAAFARRKRLPPSIHLGKVLPKVSARARRVVPSASLRAEELPCSRPSPGDKGPEAVGRAEVTALSFKDREWKVELRVTGKGLKNPWVERIMAMAKKLGFRAEKGGKHLFWLWLRAPRIRPGRPSMAKPQRISKGPPLDRILTAQEVEKWLRRLGRLPLLGVWRLGETLEGRPIWAVEAVLKPDGKLASTAKMRLLKPTLVFNARHHANEVSGTNAALRMAWAVAFSRKGQDMLRHVNLAWIPMENADGVATLEQLLPSNPDHMLHAARYNALGVEYYGDYFEKNPRFPEAMAKLRLWTRWLPELMVDHHGVPSHEWVQPFSGYAPFRFREFWIPRTFVFALIPFVKDRTHPAHRTALRLARLLAQAMRKEREVIHLNRQMAALYERYARGPEPNVFPPSRGEPVLALPPLKRTHKTNFGVRFPGITKSEIVLEVPDEVVSGKLLELCVRAHLRVEEALILACRRTTGAVDAFLEPKSGLLHLQWVTGKPIPHNP